MSVYILPRASIEPSTVIAAWLKHVCIFGDSGVAMEVVFFLMQFFAEAWAETLQGMLIF